MPYTAAQKRSYAKKMTSRQPKKRPYTAKVRGSRQPRLAQAVPNAPVAPVHSAAPRRSNIGQSLAKVGGGLLDFGLGRLANMAKSVISGMGDYDVKGINHNSLISKISPVVPSFENGGSGSIRIAHREYIQDILSSGVFVPLAFPINPAIGTTFPWLSRIAAQFEQYRINGMVFEFKSGSSDALNSTNTALGYVVGAVEYNVLSQGYTSKLQMENALFCSSTKPSLSMITAVECAPGQTPLPLLYTRLGYESLTASDMRLYDLGTYTIATIGQQATGSNLGELWVSYDVSLYKTRFANPGLSIPTWSVTFNNVNNARCLIGSPTVKTNTIGVNVTNTFDVPSTNCISTFTFPPGLSGTYLFNWELMGSAYTFGADTYPFAVTPFGNYVNISDNNIYPNGLVQEQISWTNTLTQAAQSPNSQTLTISFSFNIDNNSLPAIFTFIVTQAVLAGLVYDDATSPPIFDVGVAYITQVSPQL